MTDGQVQKDITRGEVGDAISGERWHRIKFIYCQVCAVIDQPITRFLTCDDPVQFRKVAYKRANLGNKIIKSQWRRQVSPQGADNLQHALSVGGTDFNLSSKLHLPLPRTYGRLRDQDGLTLLYQLSAYRHCVGLRIL